MLNRWLDYLRIILKSKPIYLLILKNMTKENVILEVRLMLLLKLGYMRLPKLNKKKKERIMNKTWNRKKIYR
jgi:hypothetical protein